MTRIIKCDKCGYEEDDTPKYMRGRTFREVVSDKSYLKIIHICSKCDGIDTI